MADAAQADRGAPFPSHLHLHRIFLSSSSSSSYLLLPPWPLAPMEFHGCRGGWSPPGRSAPGHARLTCSVEPHLMPGTVFIFFKKNYMTRIWTMCRPGMKLRTRETLGVVLAIIPTRLQCRMHRFFSKLKFWLGCKLVILSCTSNPLGHQFAPLIKF